MPAGLGTRDKILWAAAALLGEEAGQALSVRAVAAKAGVSTGSLRHFFPTQRDLMSAVLTLLYDMVLPNGAIHDASIPATDRLVAVLQQLLAPEAATVHPRDAWRRTFDRYIGQEPSAAIRAEYLAIEDEVRARIESWLATLESEGALGPGDNARRARYLMTVVNGISIGQALPAGDERLKHEREVLRDAVGHVLAS